MSGSLDHCGTKPHLMITHFLSSSSLIITGIYEWKKVDKKTKIPYHIKPRNDQFFGFAGLWDTWNKDGGNLTTFAIITTTPNELIEPIHDRMAVILSKEDEQIWLDPNNQNPDELVSLMKPYPSEEMQVYEISTFVTNGASGVMDSKFN